MAKISLKSHFFVIEKFLGKLKKFLAKLRALFMVFPFIINLFINLTFIYYRYFCMGAVAALIKYAENAHVLFLNLLAGLIL